MFLHGKKWLGEKDKKGWRYDKILVHLKKFAPLGDFDVYYYCLCAMLIIF